MSKRKAAEVLTKEKGAPPMKRPRPEEVVLAAARGFANFPSRTNRILGFLSGKAARWGGSRRVASVGVFCVPHEPGTRVEVFRFPRNRGDPDWVALCARCGH